MSSDVWGGVSSSGTGSHERLIYDMPLSWQARECAAAILRVAHARVREVIMLADLDEDEKLTLEDSRIAQSRISPLLKERPAMVSGLVGGFMATFGSFR